MPLSYEKHLIWQKKRSDFVVRFVRRYKVLVGCKRCGYKEHHAGLVLDHRDQNTKDRNRKSGNRAYSSLWSMKRLKVEMRKCDVLCATCHNVRSFEEQHGLYRSNRQVSGVK